MGGFAHLVCKGAWLINAEVRKKVLLLRVDSKFNVGRRAASDICFGFPKSVLLAVRHSEDR